MKLGSLLAAAALALVLSGCGAESSEKADEASRVVGEAIRTHGGDVFERSALTFDFRDARFRVERVDGRFRYERRYMAPEGVEVAEVMTNDGFFMEVGGTPVRLSPQDEIRIETAVNSVVYFGFLPFRLDDPAVLLRDLGEGVVAEQPYRKIEVTFEQEGGGQDFDDRFVYWFHRDDGTLDYMAYRYYRDGGGTRFRRAVNRREIGGILVQDYENMAGEIADIAEYDRMFEAGELELVSMIELENLRVETPDPDR